MLSQILSTDIYRFFILFARLGAAMMLLPGLGSALVQARIRLLLGVSMAFLLLPVLSAKIPPLPDHPSQLAVLVLAEVTIGAFLGMIAQMLLSAIQIAGTFISFQVGLTNAFSYDAIAQQQGQLLTGFLSNVALAVIFATDMHHLMLQAVVDSYDLFQPGAPLPLGDFSQVIAKMVSQSFSLGMRIAAPLLVFGLVFYTGLGLLSRMVPQMQVFFVIMPVQVLSGLWLMMVSLPVMILLFLHGFEAGLLPYLTPR
ncbi:MAG: flagellar biosynthetic protein FliR [Magnetospirillum sp.]|nr:flagellar biosynthetic protein FliR [Magnetospirillum sp.]